VLLGRALPTQPEPAKLVPTKRPPAHYLWAALIARIYAVFPHCGGQMCIIALITQAEMDAAGADRAHCGAGIRSVGPALLQTM